MDSVLNMSVRSRAWQRRQKRRQRKPRQLPAKAEAAGESGDKPILDLNDAAIKKLMKTAKQRGFVTFDELNAVLPSEDVTSELIEDLMSKFSDMGVNVVEAEEAEEEADEDAPREIAPAAASAVTKTKATKEPTDRTDDPVRMYLREMGTVELLSREGEIAIAKAYRSRSRGDDCRVVREPADIPGHHHLAR